MDKLLRFVFLPGRAPSWRFLLFCLLASAAFITFVFLICAGVIEKRGPGTQWDGVAPAFVFGGFLLLVLLGLTAFRLSEEWRTYRLRSAGKCLGLRSIGELRPADLGAYRDLPLFRFLNTTNVSAGEALEGEIDGVPIRVFDLGFQTSFARHAVEPVTHRRILTVAVVPVSGPYFFRGPNPCHRDRVNPDWVREAGFKYTIPLRSKGTVPSVLHLRTAHDSAGALSPKLLAELASMNDLIVECSGDYLLVYRENQTIAAEHLGAFLYDVVRADEAVAAMSEVPRTLPAASTAPPPAEPLRLNGGIQFPLPGREPSLWLCLLAWAVAATLTGCVWASVLDNKTIPAGERPARAAFAASVAGAIVSVLASSFCVGLIALRTPSALRARDMRRAAKSAGLRSRHALRRAERIEMGALPLFAFARGGIGIPRWVLEGNAEGCAVRVFDVSCVATSQTSLGKYRSVQTVVAVSLPGLEGRFHACPGASPWEVVRPGWATEQGLLFANEITGERGEALADVHANAHAPDALAWGREAAEAGLVVEGCPGHLLVYRHNRTLLVAELAPFLRQVKRLLRARSAVLPALEPTRPVPAAHDDAVTVEPPVASAAHEVAPKPRAARAPFVSLSAWQAIVPLPGTGRVTIGPLPFVLLGLLAASAFFLMLEFGAPEWRTDPLTPIILIPGAACGWLLFTALVYNWSLIDARRTTRMHAAGLALGLTPTPCPGLDTMDKDYGASPLFRYATRSCRAVVWAMEGQWQEVPMRLFEYAFQKTGVNALGQERRLRHVQTVVALPGAGPNTTFYFGPAHGEWGELEANWQIAQELLNGRDLWWAETSAVIHARDGATLDVVFTRERQEELAAFDGLVVECCQGTLLVYRHNRAVTPEDLPRLLDVACRIARIMRDVAGWTPHDEPHRSERPAPPSRGIRRDE